MGNHKIYAMPFSKLYPCYVNKAKRKSRTEGEVIEIIEWLTGYDSMGLNQALTDGSTVADFFTKAPKPNPNRDKIKGVVCGVRVEAVEEQPMREIRLLDKLIDELAKGKAMERIIRE